MTPDHVQDLWAMIGTPEDMALANSIVKRFFPPPDTDFAFVILEGVLLDKLALAELFSFNVPKMPSADEGTL